MPHGKFMNLKQVEEWNEDEHSKIGYAADGDYRSHFTMSHGVQNR